jgi:hypothetical protein
MGSVHYALLSAARRPCQENVYVLGLLWNMAQENGLDLLRQSIRPRISYESGRLKTFRNPGWAESIP